MRTLVLSAFIGFGLTPALSAANVGVVDADHEYGGLEHVVTTIKALGHRAEKLPANALRRPTGLGHYDCIVLAHRSGYLTEAGYKALAEYVQEGGTLLLTGMAAYWMKTPDSPRARRQIYGAGPLKETAGIRITDYRQRPIKWLRIVETAPATIGLPESFAPQTTPAYDINDRANWRHVGAVAVKAESATPLIKVEAVDAEGQTVESDFLTVQTRGRGQCYRLALYQIAPMVFDRMERRIALIVHNILKSSEMIAGVHSESGE